MTSVVVIGLGYVGLPMALEAVSAGHHVWGLDLNQSMVESLNRGISHVDDVTNEELTGKLAAGFVATTNPACIAGADVVVVCVPTPLSSEGGPDLEAVEATAATIGEFLSENTLCILESTTYPGTTEEIFAPLVVSKGKVVGDGVWIAFSPERIDPGNSKFGVKNTPKVVGGLTKECGERAREFYSTFIDSVVVAKSAREAEMSKLLENTFRHVNIALVNEMVRFCDELNIDLWDAIDVAATKPFGFMAFRPGPGVGGHCIPIDPSYLSHRVKAKLGYAFRMVELAEEINHAAPQYVSQRLSGILNHHSKPVKGSTVVLLGVTYKANISDCRESPADALALQLEKLGANLTYIDPFVPTWRPAGSEKEYESQAKLSEALLGADVAVLLQNHSAFDSTVLENSVCPVLDTRGVLRMTKSVVRL